MGQSTKIIPFCELELGQEADFFVLLSEREFLKTKDGKPYYRVSFRDRRRTISMPIWFDSLNFKACRDLWKAGQYFKIRGELRQTNFGLQLDIRRIREIIDADQKDGFCPNLCRPCSTVEPEILFDDILSLAKEEIDKGPLLNLVVKIFKENRDLLLETAGSRHWHHVYAGGLLEHSLSVAKIALFLVRHFGQTFAETVQMKPDVRETFVEGKKTTPTFQQTVFEVKQIVSKPLVAAGAILHDIGKIREMKNVVDVPKHTLSGDLIGHSILSRDIIREASVNVGIKPDDLLALEHIVLAHQRFPDWNAPTVPMTLEAMIVHQADYCEASFSSAWKSLLVEEGDSELTSKKGPWGVPLYRPLPMRRSASETPNE